MSSFRDQLLESVLTKAQPQLLSTRDLVQRHFSLPNQILSSSICWEEAVPNQYLTSHWLQKLVEFTRDCARSQDHLILKGIEQMLQSGSVNFLMKLVFAFNLRRQRNVSTCNRQVCLVVMQSYGRVYMVVVVGALWILCQKKSQGLCVLF